MPHLDQMDYTLSTIRSLERILSQLAASLTVELAMNEPKGETIGNGKTFQSQDPPCDNPPNIPDCVGKHRDFHYTDCCEHCTYSVAHDSPEFHAVRYDYRPSAYTGT